MGVARNSTRLAAAVCDCWLLLYVTAAVAHNYFSQDEAFVLFSVKYSHVERLAVLRRWAGGGDLLQAQRRAARLLSCCCSRIVFCIVKAERRHIVAAATDAGLLAQCRSARMLSVSADLFH